MTRISLDIVPQHAKLGLDTCRLQTHLYLRKRGKPETSLIAAWVDTGASVSALPRAEWELLEREVIGPFEAHGAVKNERCKLVGHLAFMRGHMADHKHRTMRERRFVVFCVENCEVPALIGMMDCLDKLRLFVDLPARKAYVEEPEAS